MALPGDVGARLDLYLYSEAEQRVPEGAYKNFLSERIMEFFNSGSFDLSHVIPELPPGSIVKGPKPLIETLNRIFNVLS